MKEESRQGKRDDDTRQENARAARRWIDRIETKGADEVARNVPAQDMPAVLEAMMDTVWGGMSNAQQVRLLALLGGWTERDPEGALAWARSLRHPVQREVGLIGIAVALDKQDPRAAFEVFAETGEVTTTFAMPQLSGILCRAGDLAAKDGAAALLDFLARLPENGTSTTDSLGLNYPENFNFAMLLDGMRGIRDEGKPKPYEPAELLAEWALRDKEAAFAHVVARTGQGEWRDLSDMMSGLGEANGEQASQQWLAGKIATMPAAQREKLLLHNSAVFQDPVVLRECLAELPREEARGFIEQVIRSSSSSHGSGGFQILNELPDVEDRIAMLERLRGVKDTNGIRKVLGQWQVPQDRIDQVTATVSKPE